VVAVSFYRSYCLGDALGSEAPLPFLREVERILDGGPPVRRSTVRIDPAEGSIRNAQPAEKQGLRSAASVDQPQR